MTSLNMKTLSGFNPGTTATRSWPGRLRDFEALTRRQWLNCGNRARTLRITACASISSGGGGSGGVEDLRSVETENGSCCQTEDYKEAARLRDSLRLFAEEEPILRLCRLIKGAVANERFEDAARYRDELKDIAPHSLLKCSSDATTLGVRVQVRSVYIEGRSQPTKGQYFFAYRIRITNNSDHPVQLLRRHWIITDANGKTENVWGIVVIGEQPVILPNNGFEYSSACPLSTPSGRMVQDPKWTLHSRRYPIDINFIGPLWTNVSNHTQLTGELSRVETHERKRITTNQGQKGEKYVYPTC
ncbi:uncharacterized protein LOC131309635 [Rhododendron vialii]|uniref:uncharacterized protein LOC131309635 n=1 Tax=Rhododendron vialii TaxID=182163 RepID=UPI00265FE1E3|nr:uncharacterized protein LOC131309635 [Rhododendron vialii]